MNLLSNMAILGIHVSFQEFLTHPFFFFNRPLLGSPDPSKVMAPELADVCTNLPFRKFPPTWMCRKLGGSSHLSHEKNPGWLGYIGDYTTQLYRDYNKPL